MPTRPDETENQVVVSFSDIMVGKYKRKSDRHNWDEANMQAAINAIESKQMGWLLASKTFGVPFGTLRRRCNCQGGNIISKGPKKGYLGGKRTTFEPEVEKQIVEHIQNLEMRFFGMSTIDVRRLAYELAIRNRIPHSFNSKQKMAGWDWLKGFTQRNPEISLRRPEATSAARARSFNKPQIQKYFELLERALEEVNFDATRIWNMDESGLSTVPSKHSKIYATKGRKQVGILTSAERGQHVSIICCMNASGSFLPPALIFPRKNMKKELIDHCPPGSVGYAQESGWSSSEIFLQWLNHFVNRVKPSADEKVILLLDGHSSHKSLDAQIYAKDKGVILFCFPPHCTHRVQPLDVSFFGPLSTYFNQELSNWLKHHPGRVVTHLQVGEIFNQAYQKAATIANAIKGFSTTGIFPFNSNVFPEWMFLPAEVTDVEVEGQTITTATEARKAPEPASNNSGTSEKQATDVKETRVSEPSSSSSTSEGQVTKNKNFSPKCLSVRPVDISPLPKALEKKNATKQTRRGKYGVLNTTPEIQMMKNIVIEKEAAALRKAARAAKKKLKISEDEDEPQCEDVEDDDDDAACIYCNDLYSNSRDKEPWIRCQKCSNWCHCHCADVKKSKKMFVCELCL